MARPLVAESARLKEADAPATLLDDGSKAFKRDFARADLILAKGQGNGEVFRHYGVCPRIAWNPRGDEISYPIRGPGKLVSSLIGKTINLKNTNGGLNYADL